MKKARFTQERIIGILKEHQVGATAADLCRRHGISDATFYTWRSKYGGMEVSEARRLTALEEENTKLKRLLAESVMDVSTLKACWQKTRDARFAAGRRGLRDPGERLFAATGLPAYWHGSEDLALCVTPLG
ncbi:Insertion element ISR1 10 kDa protein A3 [Gluconacetobacter sp. SXCC-1]|nr:Low calcium response locus protein [Komagataeibacter europaeus]EGG78493.1 Insertion element ISR1 10 kDa protein A3 [Gluconacetobacter sp. SXCC-1]